MPERSRQREDAAEQGERRALAWLARRPLTEAELRQRLAAAGHAAAVIEGICRRLGSAGLIDDHKLATHFVVTRAERLGHGRERLVGDLVRRGVSRSTAAAAWDEAVERGDLVPSRLIEEQLRRRLPREQRLDRRAYARVYHSLLRSGFPADSIRRAMAPFRAAAVPDDDAFVEGVDDDLA